MAEALPEGEIISPAATIVMLALCVVYEVNGGRATVREVAFAADRSLSTTHHHLLELRDAGLCSWDDRRAGTLRPTVELVLGPWVTRVLEAG